MLKPASPIRPQTPTKLIGPPVYRPGQSPVAPSQGAAGRGAVQPQTRLIGPPVYRPQQAAATAQRKDGGAPPVYRPSQAIHSSAGNSSVQGVGARVPRLIGPPVYTPPQALVTAQPKTGGAPAVYRPLRLAVKPLQVRMGNGVASSPGGAEAFNASLFPGRVAKASSQGSLQLRPESLPIHRRQERGVVQRTTIYQPGYSSGDMFGIAAALILDSTLKVVVTTSNPKTDQTDVGDKIKAFYESSLPKTEHGRIKLVEVSSIRKPTKEDNSKIDAEISALEGGKTKTQVKKQNLKQGVGYGTTYIGSLTWGDTQRNQIRTAWGVDDSKDNEIKEWLVEKGIPLPEGKRIAILWSRFSGKKGDVHLEHDTGFEGMRELIREAQATNDVILIAGDKPIKSPAKYEEMQQIDTSKVFNITAFWDQKTEKLNAWCQSRNDQFKLYDYLKRKGTSVKHLGFRSGNLEAYALIGHTVRYLEETGSRGGERMEKWHGKGIGYERIVVEQVPTRSGKHLKTLMTSEDYGPEIARPLWAPGRIVEGEKPPKPVEINSLNKGFATTDIEGKIREYLSA